MQRLRSIAGLLIPIAFVVTAVVSCSPAATSPPTAPAITRPTADVRPPVSSPASTPTIEAQGGPTAGPVPSPAATARGTGPNPAVLITYSPHMALSPSGSDAVLTVDLTIRNSGYGAFNTSPSNLKALVDNIPYTYDPDASAATGKALQAMDLPDGGVASGEVVFLLPAGAASSRVGYAMSYAGPQLVNVQWSTLPTSVPTPGGTSISQPTITVDYVASVQTLDVATGKSVLVLDLTIQNTGYPTFEVAPIDFEAIVANVAYHYDAAATTAAGNELKAVSVPNGGRASGRLVFLLPMGYASGRVGYTLRYAGAQLYNIQWVRR